MLSYYPGPRGVVLVCGFVAPWLRPRGSYTRQRPEPLSHFLLARLLKFSLRLARAVQIVSPKNEQAAGGKVAECEL